MRQQYALYLPVEGSTLSLPHLPLLALLLARWSEGKDVLNHPRAQFVRYQRSTEVGDPCTPTSSPLVISEAKPTSPLGTRLTARGGLLNNCLTHWIPAFNDLVHVLHLARQRPGFFDVCVISVSHNPTAVPAILDCREEEVDIWSDPALEGVAVFAEFSCSLICHHFRVWEPRTENSITARLPQSA